MVQRDVDMASSPSLAPVAFAVEWSDRRAQGRSSPEKQKRVEEAPLRRAWVRKRALGGLLRRFCVGLTFPSTDVRWLRGEGERELVARRILPQAPTGSALAGSRVHGKSPRTPPQTQDTPCRCPSEVP